MQITNQIIIGMVTNSILNLVVAVQERINVCEEFKFYHIT